MKSSTARATSKPTTWTTNAAANATARDRTHLVKSSTMSPNASPPATTGSSPRRSNTVPIRQSATASRTAASSRRASPQRRSTGVSPPLGSPLGSPLEGNSPSHGGNRPTSTTRRQSPTTSVRGFTSPSSQQKKQILSHEFLSKPATKSRGPSMLTRSIDEGHQLRRHSAPPSKPQDYLSKSHDHGSLASYRSNDRGPKSLSSSQDRGPKSLSKSQNHGPKSLSSPQERGFMSKSQDRGLMSKSQDRGLMSKSQDKGLMSKSYDRESLSSYANQVARKVTVPLYGFDGRRLSTGSRDVVSQAHRISDIKAHYQGAMNRRDGVSLQLQMGRSADSTVSFSTATSSQQQSFRDTLSERSRFSPLQLSDPILSQGYRSGELTPEETSPLDARAPGSALRGTRHRQLKSPDFFDVKKVDGDGGVITAVSRMHQKANGVVQRSETVGGTSDPEDHVTHKQRHSTSERPSFEQSRRDSLAGSVRKAFSVKTDSAIGSSHFSEFNYKLEKELGGGQELLEIGSWNDDDEEYLRIYNAVPRGQRSAEGSFVDILEDTTSEPGSAASKSKHVELTNSSPSKHKWPKISEAGQFHGQYDNALYEKSEPESDLGTSMQPSPQASPPRSAPSATKAAAVSRISSNSATSIDLNRSTDTTCSTHSQYDNAFWADPPINGTFRPWNPNREAEMIPTVAPTPQLEQAHALEPSVLNTREPATDASRISRYNDGIERLTSYMKTASQSARKKRGMSDDLSSSQASGCFDYLVDFLETQQSITDVLVSAHDETLKNDLANSVAAGNMTPKRLDSKLTNDTSVMSNRSIESRITDLGSEASWESGKSRSVQTLGTTGKVMDQITEKVDSLSFDSPKHLSTFKFGLKKTTVGAFETITSSDQVTAESQPNPPVATRPFSERSLPHKPACPQSPTSNLSWRSQTAPNSNNPSRNPSRSPSQRTYSDEKLPVIGHRIPSPLSTSTREIKIVSEAGVESRQEEEAAASPSMSNKPPVAEVLRKESPRRGAKQAKKSRVERKVTAEAAPAVDVAVKDVQMHSRDGSGVAVRVVEGAAAKAVQSGSGVVKGDRDSLSLSLDQANKGGCGCNIL